MYYINMEIIYIIETLIIVFLFGRTIQYQYYKRHYKVELTFFYMLMWACVMIITFFAHATYLLLTDNY